MLGKGMIGDCIAYRNEGGKLIFVRQMFQGKTDADVTFQGDGAVVRIVPGRSLPRRLAEPNASGKAPVKSP